MPAGSLSWRSLLVVFLVALALRLFALWAIPFAVTADGDPNYAPDEAAHLEEVSLLAQGKLLHWPDETASIYAAFPPTNDAPQAVTLWLGGKLKLLQRGERFKPARPIGVGYPWARLGSALVSSLACLFLAYAAAVVTGDATSGLFAGLACAFEPQFIFTGAYVNPDALSICAAAALTAALARWYVLGEGDKGIAGVGAAIGFVLATKVSGFFILVPTGAWLLWAVVKRRIHLLELTVAILLSALVFGPPLALNAVRNHGDPLGVSTYALFMRTVWAPVRHVWTDSPDSLRLFLTVLPRSAYGVFGNLSLFLPQWHYYVFGTLLGFAGFLRLTELAEARARTWRAVAWIALVVATNLALVLYNLWFVDFQTQGRYVLFSVLLIFVVAVTLEARSSTRLRFVPVAMLVMLAISSVAMERLIFRFGR